MPTNQSGRQAATYPCFNCLLTCPPSFPPPPSLYQDDLTQYAPDSEQQQSVVMSIADRDAFNWG